MLKKIRNRNPTKNQCEILEFAKKLRFNNNGKIHLYDNARNLSFHDNQKIRSHDLNKENISTVPKKKMDLIQGKEFLNEDQDFFSIKRKKKISTDNISLMDEKQRKHIFSLSTCRLMTTI